MTRPPSLPENLFFLAVQYDILDNVRRVRCSLLYKVTLCSLLYTLAGNLLGNVPALLGHSSPEARRQIYLRAIPAEQRRAAEGVETLLVGPNGINLRESRKG